MTRRLVVALLLVMGPFGAPCRLTFAAEPTSDDAAETAPLPAEVVRGHCSVCHSFRLVEQQRLDRANWEWVLEDMIVKYGATWIDERLGERMVDFLVKHYGPER